MNLFIPSNIIPWLLGSVILLFIGVRSWMHLRKVNSSTTKFFMVVGFLGGLGLACYSWPSLFTNDPQILKLGFFIGVPLIYAMFTYQSYFTWFGILKRRISYAWLLVPSLVIAITTVFLEYKDLFRDNIRIEGGELVFNFLPTSRFLQSLLISFTLVNGLWFIKESFSLKESKARIRFASIGVIFTIVGAGTIADNLFFGGDSQSKVLMYAYILSFALFFFTLLLIVRRNSNK